MQKNNKMIVVTGAAGFIGSCTVKYLNDQGITNLLLVDDVKKTEKWKNLLNKKCIDFISRHDLFKWLEGQENEVQAFIHLGACSDTMENDGNYLMENNFRYSIRLAEYAMKHGQRFIYASSAATYGDGTLGFCDDHAGLEELRPLNLYGFSKYYFDLWAKQQGILDKVVGLKYFNVFGPNENHKGRMASMVYKMLPIAQNEGRIRLFKSSQPQLFADGDQCRDFIYVKDAVRMTCEFLDNEISGIFNIGTGETTTWNALAKALFKALDKPAQIEYIDMPSDLIKQYQNYTCADMNKYIHRVIQKLVDGNAGASDLQQAKPVAKEGLCKHKLDAASCKDEDAGEASARCLNHEVYKQKKKRESVCKFTIEEAVADYVKNYLLEEKRW